MTGGLGSFSSSAAWARISPIGTWTDGRRTPSVFFSRSQSSFHVTTSGPPSSKVLPPASGLSIEAAKYAATSSTQMGWIRCLPEPTMGVTGERRASCLNCCSAPPLSPKTKLGRKITCSSDEPFTTCSIAHFAL